MHTYFKSAKQGFTLIELIIVITILAILAAVAIPNFTNLTADAKTAALNGVGGALTSASAVNYAARQENATLTGTTAIANCTGASALLAGGLPASYAISSLAVAAGTSSYCTLSNGTSSVTFLVLGSS